jgi:nitrite reductase/ring-hydroxylating ferredoxin subunit
MQAATDEITRRHLVAVAKDLFAHGAAGTTPVADRVVSIPASRYTDPEYFEAEKAKIFRRIPLIVAASCEIREAGSHTTLDIAGIPVLVVRGRDGVARAFLNVCTHRGAILAKGADTTLRLSCPYHGWVFDDKGALVGVPCRKEFGEVNTPNLGLKEFPVRERAGLIWAILDPESTLDFYHLPVLHRNTFGADVSPQAHYYHFGPHQRLARPGKRGGPSTPPHADLFAQQDLPEDEWITEAMLIGEWIVYPNVSINSFYAGGRGVLISQIIPGINVDESITIQTYFTENELSGDDRVIAQNMFNFLGDVVDGEDQPTSVDQQRALSAGMIKSVNFGRNEGGLQRFHELSDRFLTTGPANLIASCHEG